MTAPRPLVGKPKIEKHESGQWWVSGLVLVRGLTQYRARAFTTWEEALGFGNSIAARRKA